MAKKQSDGEASAEAAGKRRPQKKTAAPGPGARTKPAKAGKPSKPSKPAKPSQPSQPSRPGRAGKAARASRPTRPPAQAELPIGGVDLIEDADIVAETRAAAVELA